MQQSKGFTYIIKQISKQMLHNKVNTLITKVICL